jgi:hypothetical protein
VASRECSSPPSRPRGITSTARAATAPARHVVRVPPSRARMRTTVSSPASSPGIQGAGCRARRAVAPVARATIATELGLPDGIGGGAGEAGEERERREEKRGEKRGRRAPALPIDPTCCWSPFYPVFQYRDIHNTPNILRLGPLPSRHYNAPSNSSKASSQATMQAATVRLFDFCFQFVHQPTSLNVEPSFWTDELCHILYALSSYSSCSSSLLYYNARYISTVYYRQLDWLGTWLHFRLKLGRGRGTRYSLRPGGMIGIGIATSWRRWPLAAVSPHITTKGDSEDIDYDNGHAACWDMWILVRGQLWGKSCS